MASIAPNKENLTDPDWVITTTIDPVPVVEPQHLYDGLTAGSALLFPPERWKAEAGRCDGHCLSLTAAKAQNVSPLDWAGALPVGARKALVATINHKGQIRSRVARTLSVSRQGTVDRIVMLDYLWVAPDAQGHQSGRALIDALARALSGDLVLVSVGREDADLDMGGWYEDDSGALDLEKMARAFRQCGFRPLPGGAIMGLCLKNSQIH